MSPHGCYIHVPYCRRKCDYCNFYSVPLHDAARRRAALAAYAERLVREIGERLSADGGMIPVDTIYFGGGSPSLLGAGEVDRILGELRSRAAVAPGAEVTVEIRPDDLSADLMASYRDIGVNRAVLGVQTLSLKTHRAIGRSSAPCTEKHLDIFFGSRGIAPCVDLIAGAPGQTPEELADDIDRLAARRPAHVSAYLLSIEPGTPLAARVHPDPNREDEQAVLMELVMDRFERRGYVRYEISNHALPGCESRHNMKYWTFAPYFGFGPGAHSFTDGERYCNSMTADEYLSSAVTRLTPDRRPPRAAAAEYIMTGLRLTRGMSPAELEVRLTFRLPGEVRERIAKAVSTGLLAVEEHGDRVRLTRRGILLSNRVIYGIVEPLL